MAAERWDEQVGSVADEATRLLESLRRSAAEAQAAAGAPEGADGGSGAGATSTGATGADAPAGGTASAPPAGGTASAPPAGGTASETPPTGPADPATGPDSQAGAAHDPFCTWCPLCRGAAVVRSLSPETLTRLADLATLAASVLADLAVARATPPSGDRGSSAATRRPPAAASRPIPVRDADDAQEDTRG